MKLGVYLGNWNITAEEEWFRIINQDWSLQHQWLMISYKLAQFNTHMSRQSARASTSIDNWDELKPQNEEAKGIILNYIISLNDIEQCFQHNYPGKLLMVEARYWEMFSSITILASFSWFKWSAVFQLRRCQAGSVIANTTYLMPSRLKCNRPSLASTRLIEVITQHKHYVE
jgi:hypothetical protein